jgi:hypothetical protein
VKSSEKWGLDSQTGTESGTESMMSLIDSWSLLTADDRRRIIAIVNGRLA